MMENCEGDVLYLEEIEDSNGHKWKVPAFHNGRYLHLPTPEEAEEILKCFENLGHFSDEEIVEKNEDFYENSGEREFIQADNEAWTEYKNGLYVDAQNRACRYFDYDPAKVEEIRRYAAKLVNYRNLKKESVEDIMNGFWHPKFKDVSYVLLFFKDKTPVVCSGSSRKMMVHNVTEYKKKHDVDSVSYVIVPGDLVKEVILDVKVQLGLRIKGMTNISMIYASEKQIVAAYEQKHGIKLKLEKMKSQPVAYSGNKQVIYPIYRKLDIDKELGLSDFEVEG